MEKFTLKGARYNANLTQCQAASRIGISVPTLSRYESGKQSPKLKTLQKICEVYGITIEKVTL